MTMAISGGLRSLAVYNQRATSSATRIPGMTADGASARKDAGATGATASGARRAPSTAEMIDQGSYGRMLRPGVERSRAEAGTPSDAGTAPEGSGSTTSAGTGTSRSPATTEVIDQGAYDRPMRLSGKDRVTGTAKLADAITAAQGLPAGGYYTRLFALRR